MDTNDVFQVTIGIVLYNSKSDIDVCLQRLQQQTFKGMNIVLLDNASADGSADWVETHWPQYRLIRSKRNLGFGNGHNRIIADTDSAYYMPLNPDVILQPTYLEAMVNAIESEHDIGSVSGKLYLFENENEIMESDNNKLLYTVGHAIFRDGYPINIGYQQHDHPKYQVQREIFGVNAAASLYRRTMLQDVQYAPGEIFDTTIFLYYEDVDLDCRSRLLGWRSLFTPDAVGYHTQGASGGTSLSIVHNSLTGIRYYAVFKYAFLFDLLTYNIPTFILHSLFMLVTQPQRGLATVRYIIDRLGDIRRKRKWLASRRKITRQDLQGWYDWSAQQGQEKSYSYLARFWRGRILRKPASEE